MKKILLLFGTHGDEVRLKKVLDYIDKNLKKYIDYVIVNEKASLVDKRFIEKDINRIAPGNIKSSSYEEKRVAEIINLSKKYDIVIDIHGTNSKTGIFTLITKFDIYKLNILSFIDTENVIIWQSGISRDKGPITQFINNGIEIEVGEMNKKSSIIELSNILNKFIDKIINQKLSFNDIIENQKKKSYYEVVAKTPNGTNKNIEDFDKITVNKKSYYAIFTNNNYKNVSYYLMKKIDLDDMIFVNINTRNVDFSTKTI